MGSSRVPDGSVPPSGAQWKRRNHDRHRELVRAANAARRRAVALLIAAHPERFAALYEQEAAAEGIVPQSVRRRRREQAETPEQLEQEIARLQAQLDQARAQEGEDR
jgi:hypothetical protein